MGQYYVAVIGDDVYDTYMEDGTFVAAKLTEHSWVGNKWVEGLTSLLFDNPHAVWWMGDSVKHHPVKDMPVWRKERLKAPLFSVPLNGFYIVNHTVREYLDFDEYYKQSVDSLGHCFHPLPLLTAVGNGDGGGDYTGVSEGMVGIWAGHFLEVTKMVPSDYKEICPLFSPYRF